MLAWILIFLLLAGAALYFIFTPKDVDPDFIQNQASVASTKLPNESPIVRSLANPHGRVLLGESHPLRDFRFRDVWVDSASFRIKYVTKHGQVVSIERLKPCVQQIRAALAGYAPNSPIGMRFGVGVDALLSFFAITMSGLIPVLVDEDEEDLEHEGNDHVVITTDPQSGDIVVKQADGQVIAAANISNPEIGAHLLLNKKDEEFLENSENKVVLEHVYVYFEDRSVGKIVTVMDNKAVPQQMTMRLSERDLGTAIAAQLTALGTQHRWTHRDTVFVAPGPLSVHSFVAMLTALSAQATLLFAEADPLLTATNVLQLAKPTVLVSNDETMRTLVKRVDDYTALTWLDYAWRRLRLSRGALSSPPMIPEFRRVRLVHTESGADPYRWLSNGDIATLRVLTGTQVVHTFTPTNDLAVSQTSIGDYRTKSPSKEPAGVNWGPPLPGLELKKIGTRAAVRRANHAEFELLPLYSSEDATLLRDGCLYVPEKRHDFSEYYYYTGELY